MYNEIYKGIVKLFHADEEEKADMRRIPHFLSITYNFDPLQIVNVVDVDLGNAMPGVVLVLANAPDNNPSVSYSDTVVLDGEVKRIILFNLDAYMSEDITVKLTRFVWSVWETCFAITEHSRHLLDPEYTRCTNYTNLIYYAPMFVIIKSIDKLIGDVSDAKVAAVLSNFYKRMVYPDTVRSARILLEEVSITDLLDNSLWLSVTNDIYPYIRFDEIDEEDENSGEDI